MGYRDRRWAMADGQRSNEHEVIGNVHLEPDRGRRGGERRRELHHRRAGRARASAVRLRGIRGPQLSRGDRWHGRFTLANVEAGADYRLWVRPQSGFKDGGLENVIVDAGVGPFEVQLTPIGIATLTGRMVTPEGATVPGFTMWLTSAYGRGPQSLPVTSDGQGRFVAELPEGPVSLQTRAAPALSVSGIEVSAATAAADVTVVVDVGAHRLEGRLLTSEGAPAAGARVSLEWSASSGGVTSRSSRKTITDADGTFVFTQLGGGIHIVSATLAGAGSYGWSNRSAPASSPFRSLFPESAGINDSPLHGGEDAQSTAP